MKADVLGVKVDDVDMAEALARIEKWIWNPGPDLIGAGKHYIVTPNPEFVVAAQKDDLFKKVLNEADLAIPDGAGLKLSGKVKNTISGTDLMEKLVALSAEKGFVAAFLGGREGIAKKCSECLKKKYPQLRVGFVSEEPGKILPADILFVAFGHIKQEKWIANNLEKIPVKVAMGVGGAFDYLSGVVPRAPEWMRSLGFEWLFRLAVQPWRIKRQLALGQYILYLLAEYIRKVLN